MNRLPTLVCFVSVCTVLLASAMALAVRPTYGGIFTYDDSDELAFYDSESGGVRVHYSVAGPNRTLLADDDENGVPDYVEEVADVAERSRELYIDALGFRAPVVDASFNLWDDGGSEAVDIYLVDFAGQGDGQFSQDQCNDEGACSGALLLENDFSGYAYQSVSEAVDTVVPHEFFHAIQAAYTELLPIWASEGMAVWAERQFAPESRDFRAFASAYLSELDRPFHRPPGGPVPAFAYGVGIWWEFVSLQTGVEGLKDFLDSVAGSIPHSDDALANLLSIIRDSGQSVQTAWETFAEYNLATGRRAGLIESYRDAPSIYGLNVPTLPSRSLVEATRFYPLTAHYYRVEHGGGPLALGASKSDETIVVRFYDSDADERVREELTRLQLDDLPSELGSDSLSAGVYYLAVTNSETDGDSVRSELCLGGSIDDLACLAEDTSEQADASDSEGGAATDSGSGCAQSGMLPWLGLLLMRRRQSSMGRGAG